MPNDNICCFIPYKVDNDRINTIHFVYETKQFDFLPLKSSAVYVMALVCEGVGRLHTLGKSYELKKGDIFFILAASPYGIEHISSFEYAYISFIGRRANEIMDTLKIKADNCVFHGFDKLIGIWKDGFDTSEETLDLASEGLLLYSFSVLGTAVGESQKSLLANGTSAQVIKKFIDDNFSNPELNISRISDELSYNRKYISSLFKGKFGIGISDYLTVIRIQHACTLMNRGLTCIKEIAYLSGYNDSLYFSKVFKRRTGMTPSEYIADLADN